MMHIVINKKRKSGTTYPNRFLSKILKPEI